MNKNVELYVREHKAMRSDVLIFRDWEAFMQVLYDNDVRVEMIVWYEYCKVNEQQVGMGGYLDPENQGFMWAETQLFKTNLQEKTQQEITEYIEKTQKENPNIDLFPEFYLC